MSPWKLPFGELIWESSTGAVFGRQSRNLFRTLEVKDYKGQCGEASEPMVLELGERSRLEKIHLRVSSSKAIKGGVSDNITWEVKIEMRTQILSFIMQLLLDRVLNTLK